MSKVVGVHIPYETKNLLYNSNFDIWQRGTSFTTVNAYTADRWYYWHNPGSTTKQTISDLPGSQYSMRWYNTSGVGESNLLQALETLDTVQLHGKFLTLSFYMKKGPSFTGNINVFIGTSTSADTKVAAANDLASISVTSSVSTSWSKVTVTTNVAVPSTAKTLTVSICHQNITGYTANDWLEIAQLCLNEGATAFPFKTKGKDSQQELESCQRYYIRYTGTSQLPDYTRGFTGFSNVDGNWLVRCYEFPVAMRVAPNTGISSTTDFGFHIGGVFSGTIGSGLGTTLNAVYATQYSFSVRGSNSYTTLVPCEFYLISGTGWLDFSAEL